MKDEIWAVVRDFEYGHRGWYAIAWSSDPDITGSIDPEISVSITLLLKRPVWNEAIWPEKGTYVVIPRRYLIPKVAGWRALRARFARLNEEPPEWTKRKKRTRKEEGEQEK